MVLIQFKNNNNNNLNDDLKLVAIKPSWTNNIKGTSLGKVE